MLNIVLTRIDDRLIHGQVITAWSKITAATRIIVVDDEVSKDPFMAKVLKIAAPSTVKVEVYSIEEASGVLKGEDTEEKVIVLVKYPTTVLELVKREVGIKELNVGGMGASKGRKSFYKNISVSQEEKDIFKELTNKGMDISIQIVPDAKKIDVAKLI